MSVGKHQPHDSGVGHVTGRAQYVDDMPPQSGELHVALGLATIASGKLLALDLEPVRQAPGVRDVITFADLPHLSDVGPVFPGDPLLVDQDILFHGQALFAVAADSHRAARQAATLARVQYQQQDALLNLAEARERAAYVRPPHRMQRGDVETALAAAPHRIRGEVANGGQEHFYLEGQVARAEPADDGGVVVYSSNQNPTEAQHLVAEVLGIPMHKVTVVVRRMGGGFGGKETQATPCAAFAALFARRLGCAVRCRLSRRDDMLTTGKRHAFLSRYEAGFDEQGNILAVRYELTGQCGYSPDLSDAIVDRAMFHCDNAYFLPSVEVTGLRCQTHSVSNTAFRGFGGPQGVVAMETVIDHVASSLGMDALDVRRRNLYGAAPRNLTPYHQEVDTFTVPRMLEQLERSIDYPARRAAVSAFNRDSTLLKRGLALTPVKFGISFTVTHLNQAGALLHIYSDGSVQLNHGGTEMGQGLMVKVRQIVAAELGMSDERIAIMATRTDKVPNTSATAASSGTDLNGMAALDAARKLTTRLRRYLMESHQAKPGSIQFANDGVRFDTEGASDHHLAWPELAKAAYLERVSLSATGFYRTPDIHYDREAASGQPFFYFANGVAATEVEIDTLTGETRVLRTDILQDVGRSVNPAIDIGQVEGAYVQGLGWLTHEELHWNESGRLMTDGPATYKIPTVGNMPLEMNVALLADSPNEKATVYHSKAVGEPPFMLAISAWAAIRDAIAALSDSGEFPPLNAPATPEEILRCCMAMRSGKHS